VQKRHSPESFENTVIWVIQKRLSNATASQCCRLATSGDTKPAFGGRKVAISLFFENGRLLQTARPDRSRDNFRPACGIDLVLPIYLALNLIPNALDDRLPGRVDLFLDWITSGLSCSREGKAKADQ
jgi:hypothetical protein